jgi:hypothetical protein
MELAVGERSSALASSWLPFGVLGMHHFSWHHVFATAGASHAYHLMPSDVTSPNGIAASTALALPDTGETTNLAQGSPLTAAIHGTCDGACENHQVVAV